jgi:hypothetical protein
VCVLVAVLISLLSSIFFLLLLLLGRWLRAQLPSFIKSARLALLSLSRPPPPSTHIHWYCVLLQLLSLRSNHMSTPPFFTPTVAEQPTALTAALPAESAHAQNDCVTAVRGSEVVKMPQRKRHTRPSKQREASVSSGKHHHHHHHHTQHHSGGSRRRTSTSPTAGGADTTSGGSFHNGLMGRRSSKYSQRHSDRGRDHSPTSRVAEHEQKETAEDENTYSVHNHPPPPDKDGSYALIMATTARTPIEELDSNGMNGSANTHVNAPSESSQQHQSEQHVYVVPAATESAGTASHENNVKAAAAGPSLSRTSSGQETYRFIFPSFAAKRVSSPAHVQHYQKQQQPPPHLSLYGNEEHQQALSASKTAFSVLTDIRAKSAAAAQPNTVHGYAAVPARRMLKDNFRRPHPQQLASHARRLRQSLGEWNLNTVAPEEERRGGVDIQPFAEASIRYGSIRGRRESIGSVGVPREFDAERSRRGDVVMAPGRGFDAVHVNEPGAHGILDYRFPSIFGGPHNRAASSPPQSFALVPGARQGTFVAGPGHAGPSVMWRSAFNDFATVEAEEQTNGLLRSRGGVDEVALPQSLYSPMGPEGTGTAAYSFFAPMNIPPPVFANTSPFADGEEEGVAAGDELREGVEQQTRELQQASTTKGAVRMTLLQLEAPMSDDDDDDNDDDKKRERRSKNDAYEALGLVAPLSGTSRQRQQQQRAKRIEKTRMTVHRLPSVRKGAFVKQSSLFVANGASFPLLTSAASGGEDNFWNQSDSDVEEETAAVNDNESIGKTIDLRERSLHSSDSELFVGLHRKATMYGRRWLEETGRGVVDWLGTAASTKPSAVEEPSALHSTSDEPSHPRQNHRNVKEGCPSPHSSSSSTSSSSSSRSSSDDAASDTPSDDSEASETHGHDDMGYDRPAQQQQEDSEDNDGETAMEEEEEYLRAYPSAPAPQSYVPSQRGSAWNAPLIPLCTHGGFPRRGGGGGRHPFTQLPPQQQQQERHRLYRMAARAVMIHGCPQSDWSNSSGVTRPRGTAYTQAHKSNQGCHSSPHDFSPSSASPNPMDFLNGCGVPFRQTAAGPVKVHELLGLDPAKEIRWVRSPEWRRLPYE